MRWDDLKSYLTSVTICFWFLIFFNYDQDDDVDDDDYDADATWSGEDKKTENSEDEKTPIIINATKHDISSNAETGAQGGIIEQNSDRMFLLRVLPHWRKSYKLEKIQSIIENWSKFLLYFLQLKCT